MLDKVQTVPAGADEEDGGSGVLGDGEGEGEGAGRQGHWTAVTGRGKALVSAGQSMSGALEEGRCTQDSAVH